MANKLCQKCGKMLDEDLKFYTYKSGDKTEMCKQCLTMHIDNFDESTFLWLLEKMDVPYVPEQWNSIRERAYAKNPNLNGMSVFGKYLSMMKLKQWKNYCWADTEKIQAEMQSKKEDQLREQNEFEQTIQQQYAEGKIGEAEYKTLTSAATQSAARAELPIQQPKNDLDEYYSANTSIVQEQFNEAIGQLTQDDKVYLAMKWGSLYKPEEWIELEKKYTEMTNSFDIQDADTISTLILICKTNLKMNQALDCGDVEGFQKLSKVSESLRKSAKFTAAQNKEEKNDFVDSVGELVALCEKDGFIPRYTTDIEQDKVDLTLKDMENYLYKLVTQDLGFGQQIEDALKKIQIQKQMDTDAQMDLNNLDNEESIEEMIDADYADFYESVADQKLKDAQQMKGEDE